MLNTASGEQNKHFLQRPLHLNSSKTLLIKKKKKSFSSNTHALLTPKRSQLVHFSTENCAVLH